jgi:hypothetical protein
MTYRAHSVLTGLILIGLGWPAFAAADVVTYTVDDGLSVLTLSGDAAGAPLEEQAPGSLTTNYTGVIDADIQGSQFQLIGGTLDANVSGSYVPGVGGSDGSAPGDYGASVDFGLLGSGDAAVRGLTVTVTSPLLPVGSTFDASQITATITGGNLDYDAGLLGNGREPLDGSGQNADPNGTFSTVGSVETITVPVDLTIFLELFSPNDSELHIVGQVVASRTVPLLLGDMDCDGDIDFDDIDAFVLGLNDPSAYEDQYGAAPIEKGDIDGDGNLDFDDIDGFVALLGAGLASGGAQAVPEPSVLTLLAAAVLTALLMRRRP